MRIDELEIRDLKEFFEHLNQRTLQKVSFFLYPQSIYIRWAVEMLARFECINHFGVVKNPHVETLNGVFPDLMIWPQYLPGKRPMFWFQNAKDIQTTVETQTEVRAYLYFYEKDWDLNISLVRDPAFGTLLGGFVKMDSFYNQ